MTNKTTQSDINSSPICKKSLIYLDISFEKSDIKTNVNESAPEVVTSLIHRNGIKTSETMKDIFTILWSRKFVMALIFAVAVFIVLVVAHDGKVTGEDLDHMAGEGQLRFHFVVGAFIIFILCITAFHCYLKLKERQKIEMYMNYSENK